MFVGVKQKCFTFLISTLDEEFCQTKVNYTLQFCETDNVCHVVDSEVVYVRACRLTSCFYSTRVVTVCL